MTATAAGNPQLLFNWDAPRRRNFAVAGFLFASFVFHLAGFYLFQIVYPPAVSLLPAPQRVNVVNDKSEDGARLLRWVEAEDPALAFATRRPMDTRRHALKVEHVPSYFAREPALKRPPPLTVNLRVPTVQPPGPVPTTRRGNLKPLEAAPTGIIFSDELSALGQPRIGSGQFRASVNGPPENARFRIGVDGHGAVRFCFTETSSGDAALDEQAQERLALCRFARRSTTDADALTWGTATVEWGTDVAAPDSKSSPVAP
jgi:hypothetical protein